MKRTILSLMLLWAWSMFNGQCSMALAQSDAMYIYRNDGEFNAFFKSDIDSIAQSHYDADSVYHADWQMQVVYTQDSIYRIPLAAIDSVSFIQPETIFQPNVVQMDKEGLMDYLLAVDGMSLLFRTTIPRDLQPQVGEVLLCTDFDNPLLENGFAGKVLSTKLTGEEFRVDCDSIYDIFEIFEQLISIERIVDESASSRRRVDGEWISNRNSLNFNLGYSHSSSESEKVELSGSVDGTYIATVIYNITRKEQYIKLKIDHDWQYGAHLNFKKELGSFGTLFGPVASLPAIRFPAVAPVFKFQIAGCCFVKGEGNMELDFSLSSPVHSYVGEAVYRNGRFSGWNHKKPMQGSNTPNFDAAFSLNGSVQIGYMVDLWLGLDIFGSVCKVGTGLDFYIGPKLSGDFSMKVGSENPVNYYSIYKDSKIGIDCLHVDYEFFGEASLAGHKFPKAMFCEGSLQSPLNFEWYIMPEFSDLSVVKDLEYKQATISTTPSRDILFPLSVGMGLYDSDGNLLSTKYESTNYRLENKGFKIEQTFSSLEAGKEYTAMPFIRFLGGEIPALPTETFKISITPVTLKVSDVTETTAIAWGRIDGYELLDETMKFGLAYQLPGSTETHFYPASSIDAEGVFSVEFKDLKQNTEYRYYAYLEIEGLSDRFEGRKYLFTTDVHREPYFVWDSETNTKTFYYDEKRISRYGKLIDYRHSVAYVTDPGVYAYWSSPAEVVFDISFSKYYPKYFSFTRCNKLQNIKNLNFLNTDSITSMNEMFFECFLLTSLDISHFNTGKTTDMKKMFYNCAALTSLDVSRFNTAKVTNMMGMFYNCAALTNLDVSRFNTAKVTDMAIMFCNCSSLTSLDLSGFNTSNVTNMGNMFNDCNSLTSLNLSSFNTSNVTNMEWMFMNCKSLKNLDLSSFRTSKVKKMSYMFYGCSSLTTLNLSNFSVDYTKMDSQEFGGGGYNSCMFNGCGSLRTIYAKSWNIKNDRFTFYGCNNLVGGRGTKIGSNFYGYDSNGNPLYYNCGDGGDAARIDDGKDAPGLFTAK